MSVMQRRCHRRKLPEKDKRRQRARSQGFAFWEELGQLLGMASYKQTPGGPTNGAGTQYRCSGGTAGGASPPHAQKGGPRFQGAVQEWEEMRHRNRRVRARWNFSEGLLGDATGSVIPGPALLDDRSWV